jgi:hypothetical protein
VPWLWDLWPILGEENTPYLVGVGYITPYLIGLSLFVLASVPVIARLVLRQDRRTLWICSSALALALFVLLTRMHERYAFPFFALALPLAATSPRWLICYVVLSLSCFANVYAVYSLPLLNNARLQRTGPSSWWPGQLAVSPRWQGGEDSVSIRVKLARGGKLLQRLRSIPESLIGSPELKSSVGVTRGELDGTPQ